MAKDDLKFLPLGQIRPNEVALRSVDKATEKYIGLVDSVKEKGILNPVLVREMKDPNTGAKIWALIDGLHRYTAAIDAGLEVIPAHIKSADESDVLEMQIIANIHKVETKPVQYSEQLTRLLTLNPLMTTISLAKKLGKSTTWINERLGLVKLSDPIKTVVDEGTINITNACQLSKLPKEEQENFVDRAITMAPAQFVPTVQSRVKELRDAKRQGRLAEGPKEFDPPIFLQKISDIKSELKDLASARSLINQFQLTDPLDIWKMALMWTLHIDPVSVAAARAKEEERLRQVAAAKEAKKKEREEKKQQEAALVGATVSLASSDNEDEDEDEE